MRDERVRPALHSPFFILPSSSGGEDAGWRKSQLGMTLVVFIAFFGFNFVMPILPLYVRLLGVTDVSQAALLTGVMLAVSPLLSAFFAPLWGMVADRLGRKRMVQRSLVVFAIASTLMGLVSNVWQLFLLRAAIGVFGGFTSMTMAYTVAVAPPSKASSALGMNQFAQVAGTIVGPLCAGFIADHFGLRASFFSGAAVILLGLVALTALTQDDRALTASPPGWQRATGPQGARTAPAPAAALDGETAAGPVQGRTAPAPAKALGHRAGAAGPAGLRAATRLPGFVPVMAILFLAQFVDRSFGPILPLYVAGLGTPPEQVASYSGTIISLAAVGTGLSAAVLGHLAVRLPIRRLLLVTLLAGTVLCFPMALVRTPLELLVARALLGLFAGGTLTLAYSLANQIIPPEAKGAAFGVLSSTALLGSASSPLATGALARLDLRTVFVVDSILYAAALLWAIKGTGKPAPSLTPAMQHSTLTGR
jgi:DHA1 family multidrug resistance protein-like MFS transporter